MKRKVLSLITALALCLALCPLGAWASEGGGSPSDPGTGTETPAEGDPTAELPIDGSVTVASVYYTESYIKELNKTYDAKEVRTPTRDDFALTASDGKKYLVPKSGVSFASAQTWQRGGTVLEAEPKDAERYTLSSQVTLTVPAAGDATEERTLFEGQTRELCYFTIAKKLVTPVLRKDIKKVYDGTGDYRFDSADTSPIDYDATAIEPSDKSGITFTGDFHFEGSAVGTYKFFGTGVKITGSKAGNYEIRNGSADIETPHATIEAAAPPVDTATGTLLVRNRRERTYTYNLEDLLPETAGQYGKTTYTLSSSSVILDGFFEHPEEILNNDVVLDEETNQLTVHIKSASHDGPNEVAQIYITISSKNYQNITAILYIRSDDRTPTRITGLSTIRPEYNGKPQVGYTGRPVFSVEQADGTWMALTDAQVSPDSLVRTYQSTSRSQTVYGPSPEPPTEPGEYRVTLSIPESNEDYAGSWTGEFTITRAVVTVTALERHIQVDDPVPDLSKPVLGVDYTVSGLAEGDELRTPPTLKYSPDADSIMPGEFDILIDGAMVPDNTHYDPAIKFVRGKLTVTSLLPDQENPFSDVSNYTWYSTAVKYVYNRGLMRGVSATLFDPTSDLTRGMLVTILYRMEGEPAMGSDMPFTDLERRGYYLNAVRWAKYNRIVNGYGDGRFGPNDSLTREQMAIILYNYSRYCGVNVNKAASLDAYVDAYDTCSAGYRALQWACAEGLIQGTSDTTLSPTQTAMRAQVALVLMRYCMNIL